MRSIRTPLAVTATTGVVAAVVALLCAPAGAVGLQGPVGHDRMPVPTDTASTSVASIATAMPGMMHPGVAPFAPNLDPGERNEVTAIPALATTAARFDPKRVSHHEFQVDCTPNHTAKDDPIVFPGHPGASHDHTFLGASTTSATSTTRSLAASTTSCTAPDDHSAYWYPTLFAGDRPIVPADAQVIYYKSGLSDYRSVRPFPTGLRFVAGSPMATPAQFAASPGTIGYSCGGVARRLDFSAFTTTCPKGQDLQVRYQAPSCWDGVHLDSADHRSHMAYPVRVRGALVCAADHPVAVPMLEFKIHFDLRSVQGDISKLRLASGAGSTWHVDFFDAWQPRTLAALVTHCITGGLQCDSAGYDQHKASRGRVLDAQHRLLARPAR